MPLRLVDRVQRAQRGDRTAESQNGTHALQDNMRLVRAAANDRKLVRELLVYRTGSNPAAGRLTGSRPVYFLLARSKK